MDREKGREIMTEVEITCRVCGEKLEAKNYQEILIVELNHLQQSHKETFDELEAKLAKVYDIREVKHDR